MTIKKAIIKALSFFNEEHIKQHNMNFKKGQEYLCLGFTEKEEGIVLVNGEGRVFELEYEKENFEVEGTSKQEVKEPEGICLLEFNGPYGVSFTLVPQSIYDWITDVSQHKFNEEIKKLSAEYNDDDDFDNAETNAKGATIVGRGYFESFNNSSELMNYLKENNLYIAETLYGQSY